MNNTNLYPDTGLLINNQWSTSSNEDFIAVLNPATEAVIGYVASATEADLEKSVKAAVTGFHLWRQTSPQIRCVIMQRAASLLAKRSERIARLITLEQGKPLKESLGELSAAVDIILWFSDPANQAFSRFVPSRDKRVRHHVQKEPVGPVAAFTPWNYPVNQILRKLCAALATGCSIVVKGPEETPAAPAALMQTFIDAGVPAGVIGLVYGHPEKISSYLIAHPAIRKVTFTGSTSVGKQLAALAGSHMKPATMELGGHAPVIVTAGYPLDDVIRTVGVGAFRNAGQVCISPTRFLVHESLYEEFIAALKISAEKLVVGDGLDESVNLGPLANERRIAVLERQVRDALEKGAELVTGGARINRPGYFFSPTVIGNVSPAALLFNEEPFGPIAGVWAWKHLDDAIAESNRLPYGLAAYLFSQSGAEIDYITARLEAGMVWVNQKAAPYPELPFGGVKESGYGREGGTEAFDGYLTTKTVSVDRRLINPDAGHNRQTGH